MLHTDEAKPIGPAKDPLENEHRRVRLSSYSHAFPGHAANPQASAVQRSGLGFRDQMGWFPGPSAHRKWAVQAGVPQWERIQILPCPEYCTATGVPCSTGNH